MGGLSGHMMHPHDDLRLTFDQFADLASKTLSGQLRATEKVDGFNCHILWKNGEPRIARSKGDLRHGGFASSDLDERFAHNPIAAKVFKIALSLVPDTMKLPDFDESHLTLNCEIITEGALNEMWYGKEELVTHNIWEWETICNGFEVKGICDVYDEFRQQHEVVVHGPRINVRNLLREVWPAGTNTVKEFYQFRLIQELSNSEWAVVLENKELVRLLFERLFEKEKPYVRIIRKVAGELSTPAIQILSSKTLVRRIKWPLEKFVLQMGSLILKSTRGYINEGCEQEVMAHIDLKFDRSFPVTANTLYQFDRLQACNFQINPLEGVVVEYLGSLYKWTGSFGPLNQL